MQAIERHALETTGWMPIPPKLWGLSLTLLGPSPVLHGLFI